MSTCKNCYRQGDGSFIGRFQRNGAWAYILADGTITTAAPAGFTSANEVAPVLCEQQFAAPDYEFSTLCEVDANNDETGNRVHMVAHVDPVAGTPVTNYFNVGDGSAYTAPAGASLVPCGESDQFDSERVVMCDEGTTFVRWYVTEDGEPTGTTFDVALDGSTHTASGNETPGACGEQIDYDTESACFIDASSADNLQVTGSVKRGVNKITGVVVSVEYVDDQANVLDQNVYTRVECC